MWSQLEISDIQNVSFVEERFSNRLLHDLAVKKPFNFCMNHVPDAVFQRQDSEVARRATLLERYDTPLFPKIPSSGLKYLEEIVREKVSSELRRIIERRERLERFTRVRHSSK